MDNYVTVLIYKLSEDISNLNIIDSVISATGVIVSLATLFFLYKNIRLTQTSITYSHSPQPVPINSYFEILSNPEHTQIYTVDKSGLSFSDLEPTDVDYPKISITNIGMAAARDIKVTLSFNEESLKRLLRAIRLKDSSFNFNEVGQEFISIRSNNAGTTQSIAFVNEYIFSALPPTNNDLASSSLQVMIPSAVFHIIEKAEFLGVRPKQQENRFLGATLKIEFNDIAFQSHQITYNVDFPIIGNTYFFSTGSRKPDFSEKALVKGYVAYSSDVNISRLNDSEDNRNIF